MTSPAWTAGYVSDVAYTLGFHAELAPAHIDYALTLNGIAGPGQGPLSYCELGCGRGFGTLLLAAANPDSRFVGVDFNPGHIQEARTLAERAGLQNIRFVEASFGEAARSETEPFDIVALHGVYSWVSAPVRDDIHEFLRRLLRAGGVALVSYNCYPGWAATAPIHHLMREVAERTGGDSLRKVSAARQVLEALAPASNGFLKQNPPARQRLESMQRQAPAYLAHEYLNENWQPFYVTEVRAALAEAKLEPAGSAVIAENRELLAIPPDILALVRNAPDPGMRELLKDFGMNRQFRRDLFVKGTTRLPARESERRQAALTVALLTSPRDPLPAEWPVPSGAAQLNPEAVDSVLQRLAEGPASIAELRAASARRGLADIDVATIVDILIHVGVAAPCRRDFATVDRAPAARLNAVVAELARTDDNYRYLAAPVLGSAVAAASFDCFTAPVAAAHAASDDAVLAAAVVEELGKAGKRVMRAAVPIADKDEAAAEIEKLVRAHRQTVAPRWRALGVQD
jgi:SAM-dependent methyltransferase